MYARLTIRALSASPIIVDMKSCFRYSSPRQWRCSPGASVRFSLDFYSLEGGRKSPVTLGLAVLSGVCHEEFACVIGELGVTNQQVRFAPRVSMLTSSYFICICIRHWAMQYWAIEARLFAYCHTCRMKYCSVNTNIIFFCGFSLGVNNV